MLNLISNQPNIDEIYLYAKDLYEAKYQFIINKRKNTRLKQLNDSKDFIKYSNDMQDNMQDVYKNIKEYNVDKERKILIVFDDMIADMINNKNLNSIVTEFLLEPKN